MGTILTESDTFTPTIEVPNPFEPVSVADPLGSYRVKGTPSPDGDLIFSGATNQNVRVITLGGISMMPSVSVVGNDITLQLATNGVGTPTSTASAMSALFMGTPAAVALATCTAGGTGLGICGILPGFMPIGKDPLGSIRPSIQALTNRTRYTGTRVDGILLGTKTLKSVYVDGIGDQPVAATPGTIFSSGNMIGDNNVTAKNNLVSLIGNVNAASGAVNAFTNVNAVTGDVIAANEVKGDHILVSKSMSSGAVPTTSFAVGYGGKPSILAGAVRVSGAGLGGVNLVSAINVTSITHPDILFYDVTFSFNCSYAYPMVTIIPDAIGTVTNDFNARVYISSLSPLTIRVGYNGGAPNSFGFSLVVFAE